MSITANESLIKPTIVIAGQNAAVSGSGRVEWHVYGRGSQVTAGMEVAFSIESVDVAGNAGTKHTWTTDGRGYNRLSRPTLAVSMVSDNARQGYAKAGDAITIAIVADEHIISPAVQIAGQPAHVSGGGADWTATHIVEAAHASEGPVSLAIDFADLAGNAGAPVDATTDGSSVAIDLTPPTLTSATLASSNGRSASRAGASDRITLTFTASESLSSTRVLIAGQIATVNGSGEAFVATYMVAPSAVVDGLAAFSVAFEDLAGNVGATVEASTDASEVTVDTTAPTLSSVSITSSNDVDATRANVGDVITLTIVSSEAIVPPTVHIGGLAVDVSSADDSALNYTAAYTIHDAKEVSEGSVGVSVAYEDVVGNTGATAVQTSDGSIVVIDTTAPTLTRVTATSSNAADTTRAGTGDTITVSITASEPVVMPRVDIAGQGHEAVSVAEVPDSGRRSFSAAFTLSSEFKGSEGPCSVAIVLEDIASNVATLRAIGDNSGCEDNDGGGGCGEEAGEAGVGNMVTIDLTPPTLLNVSLVSSNEASAEHANVGDILQLSIVASEAILPPTVTLAGQPASVVSSAHGGNRSWAATYTIVAHDIHEDPMAVGVHIVFEDLAGNRGVDVTGVTDGSAVTVDLTAPALTIVTLASDNSADSTRANAGDTVVVTMAASEAITAPTVTIAGGAAIVTGSGSSWSARATLSAPLEAEGSCSLSVEFADIASNRGATVTSTTDGSAAAQYRSTPQRRR